MNGRKGRLFFIAGLLCIVATLFVALVIGLPLVGISLDSFDMVLQWLTARFSILTTPSAYGLVLLELFLLVWTILFFRVSAKSRWALFLLPMSLLMTYTLYTLSHVLQGSRQPLLAPWLFDTSVDIRNASLKVVIAFGVETFLLIVIRLVGDALSHLNDIRQERQRRKQLKQELKEQQRLLKKQKKQKTHPKPVQVESDQVTLTKKPVPEERVEEGIPIGTNQVEFPPVADVPKLTSLSRKRSTVPVAEPDPIKDVGKVSLGALHTIKEESKRHNGVPYLERKAQEVEQRKQEGKPTENVQLSGFLVGALEAVGKAPKKPLEKRSEPLGRGKGMLVDAVERQQTTPIQPTEPSFPAKEQSSSARSVENPETMPVVEPPRTPSFVETPKPVTVIQSPVTPAFVDFPKPPVLIEEPKPIEAPLTEDVAEPESGIAGLSGSSLLTRGKISYSYPSEQMLVTYPKASDTVDEDTRRRGDLLVDTLQQFSVNAELVNIVRGPTVTMFELLPAPGVRVNSIVNLADNIALALAATQVRIVAPIPGRSAVGVEIPNRKRDIIGFKELLPSLGNNLGIPMALGRNLLGEPVVIDVVRTPHMLIAGSTGSGKSVCVNSLICSVLFKRSPKQVRMILVDPKIVELNIYNGIPHLLTPVITDAKRTLKALDFCLYEMDRRYRLLKGLNSRNIDNYNEKIEQGHIAREKLPYILVVIDEFADLMHLVGKDMESKVSRLAAMSRAVGIHMVLATQRPSVDVITGVIKNNIPTRIAFAVTSATDSRIILDEQGADKLLGKGDMLYMSATSPVLERIQGAFLSDNEVEQVVRFVAGQGEPDYIDESFFEDDEPKASESDGEEGSEGGDDDELMQRALAIVVERKCASASYLQRRLKIGYNRAARLVEQMEELGYVGPPNGSKPRELIKYP